MTNKITIIITKIDHDDYCGYYIGDELYEYCERYYITDDQVKNEALLRAFEAGLIQHRSEAEVHIDEHIDQAWYNSDADDYVQNDLSPSLKDLIARFSSFAE